MDWAAVQVACRSCIDVATVVRGTGVEVLYAVASAVAHRAVVGVHGMSNDVPKQSGRSPNGGTHSSFASTIPLHMHEAVCRGRGDAMVLFGFSKWLIPFGTWSWSSGPVKVLLRIWLG